MSSDKLELAVFSGFGKGEGYFTSTLWEQFLDVSQASKAMTKHRTNNHPLPSSGNVKRGVKDGKGFRRKRAKINNWKRGVSEWWIRGKNGARRGISICMSSRTFLLGPEPACQQPQSALCSSHPGRNLTLRKGSLNSVTLLTIVIIARGCCK